MAIKEIELFHGAVLMKLLRGDRPVSLKLFEFKADASRAAYWVNDEVCLYVKHSKTPQDRQRKGFECVWHFQFNTSHLKEMEELPQDFEVFAVLVCGDENVSNGSDMFIAFLTPDELAECIDLDATEPQTITVANKIRSKLRVWGTLNTADDPLLIDKGAMDRWEVPGQ